MNEIPVNIFELRHSLTRVVIIDLQGFEGKGRRVYFETRLVRKVIRVDIDLITVQASFYNIVQQLLILHICILP